MTILFIVMYQRGLIMPKYNVRLFFNAIKDLEIEADSEERARDMALMHDFEKYDDIVFDFIESEEIT